MKILIVFNFFILSLNVYSSQIEVIDNKDLLTQCTKGVVPFDGKLTELQNKADSYIKKKGTEGVREHFKKEDDFYDFLVLFSPFLIPKSLGYKSFYTDCWVEFDEGIKELKKNSKKIAQVKFEFWSSCQKSGFKNELPKIFPLIEKCLKDLSK